MEWNFLSKIPRDESLAGDVVPPFGSALCVFLGSEVRYLNLPLLNQADPNVSFFYVVLLRGEFSLTVGSAPVLARILAFAKHPVRPLRE